VTGAAGFLGSNLCRALQLAGARVYGLTRGSFPNSDGQLEWVQADCANADELRSVLASVRPQVIYHLTGHGVGSPDLAAVLPTLRNDLVTCVNMLALATEVGFERMVLAASLEEPTRSEESPATPYAAAKWCCSTYARMFNRVYHSPVTLVRPYMTYGPGQRPHKVIPSIILSTLRGQGPELGSGSRPVDWVYVDDVVEGMIAAAEIPGVEGATIDLGSGATVTIREVAERIVAMMGGRFEPRFRVQPHRPSEIIRIADTATARDSLGWVSRTSLEEGLRKTIQWYREKFEDSSHADGLLSLEKLEGAKTV
jgi:UDP-glucose 4-epimerase